MREKWNAIHYNAIAKEIRELFPLQSYRDSSIDNWIVQGQRGIMAELALSLAKRFEDDNEHFDPLRFLDACSPDTTLYPLSDLWENS